MRALWIGVGMIVSFGLGVGAERHRSGDELKAVIAEVEVLSAQVELLFLRCKALERDAAEMKTRTQAFTQHL